MSLTTRRRGWAGETAEHRGLPRKLISGRLALTGLNALLASDCTRATGVMHYATSTRPPFKLFVLSYESCSAGGVSGVPTPNDPQSDAATPARPVKAWVTGVASTPEPSEPGPADVLGRLRGGRDADSFRAVVDAHHVTFDPTQVAELVPLLRRFIDRHLLATDRTTQVAAAAAVRGYIAHLPAADLDAVADLLARPDVPSALENELVKMVGRKLTAVPPDRNEPHPRLAEQLAGMARDYVAPKLIDRECYGAAALNAVLSLALLRTRHWQAVVGRLQQIADAGFRRQVGRRARAVLATPPPGGLPDRVATDLAELAGLAG